MVGWVDLTAPDVAERIAALREAPGGARLAGLRHNVHDEPDPGWLEREDVRRGLRAVADAGLAYDLLLFPSTWRRRWASPTRSPVWALVVDHGAKPRIADGGWEPWSADLAALAAHRARALQALRARHRGGVGGLAGATDVGALGARLLEPFGPERLMFGSDWPVCSLAATYAEVLEVARVGVDGLGGAERDEVFSGTARRFYGIGS